VVGRCDAVEMSWDPNTPLPADLPLPVNDGACDHLRGMELPAVELPAVELPATSGRVVNLAELQEPTVIFFYPRNGQPGDTIPAEWDAIPGARGCTPHSCAFRDLHEEFRALGFQVFGASTQDSGYQRELVERMHIPFEILSDAEFRLVDGMRLPTFEFNGQRLVKRMAWVIEGGRIVKVFYPVFPPDKNADEVLGWLRKRA